VYIREDRFTSRQAGTFHKITTAVQILQNPLVSRVDNHLHISVNPAESNPDQPTTALAMRITNTVPRVPTSPPKLNAPKTTPHFCLIELDLRL
jgi:hypothetical protein